MLSIVCAIKARVEGSPSMCNTVGGPESGKPCIFPFRFRDKTYNKCTTTGNDPGDDKAWCSTKTDSSGEHIQGNWGNCALSVICPNGRLRDHWKLQLKVKKLTISCSAIGYRIR